MIKFCRKNAFICLLVSGLILMSVIDITLTYQAFDHTFTQIISMLMIVPPIFVLIGLFDVWVPRQTVIKMMGQNSGIKGMALAFFLGAFSAGPTIAAFPLAMVMLKKGARYQNVLFFLMVWSSLKLPIVFFQITQLGIGFASLINVTMFVVFVLGALVSEKVMGKKELAVFYEKARATE